MRRAVFPLVALLLVLSGPSTADPIAFEPALTLDIGEAAEFVTTVDLNGDGIHDIVKTNDTGRGLTVLINQGDATFTALPTVMPDYRSVFPAEAGDVDADGDQDLLVSLLHYVGDTHEVDEERLTLLVNDGSGGLTPTLITEDIAAWSPVALIDLDGDGDLDIGHVRLAVAERGYYGLLENEGAGSFRRRQSIPLSQDDGDYVSRVAFFGDLGTDGLPELYVVLKHSGAGIIRNIGDMLFLPPVFVSSSTSEAKGVFTDVTGDGHNDIVFGDRGRILVWTGTGDGWVLSNQGYGTGTGWSSFGDAPLCVADFDGDGDRDVAVPSFHGVISVLTNRGDGSFEQNHEYDLGQFESNDMTGISFGHFDHSGEKKLLAHSTRGTWLLSTGGETPPTLSSVEPAFLLGGMTHEITLTGAGFTPETTLDLDEWITVSDIRWESAGKLVATVDVNYWDFDTAESHYGQGEFDAIVKGKSGGSSRLRQAIQVPPYWSFGLDHPKGSLKDGTRPSKDSFKARGHLRFTEARSFFKQAGEDCRLVIGSKGATFEMTIRGIDPGWKLIEKEGEVKKLTYRSAKGVTPKVKITIQEKTNNRNWQVSVKGFDFPGLQTEVVRVELHMGEVRAASIEEWKAKGPGKFRR